MRDESRRLTWVQLLHSVLVIFFGIGLVANTTWKPTQQTRSTSLVVDNVCIPNKFIRWDGNHLSVSRDAVDSILQCADANHPYVMVRLDMKQTAHPTKYNVIVYNSNTAEMYRYDPVIYGEITLYKEDVLDKKLEEMMPAGVKYLKESVTGIEGLPGVDKDLLNHVAFTDLAEEGSFAPYLKRRSGFDRPYASTKYLENVAEVAEMRNARRFLEIDGLVNACLRTGECDDQDYLQIVKDVDSLLESAPRLRKPIVVYRGMVMPNAVELPNSYEERGFTFASHDVGVASSYANPFRPFMTCSYKQGQLGMDWMEAEENCKHLISTDFKGVLMEIHIPAGVPILSWDYLSDERNGPSQKWTVQYRKHRKQCRKSGILWCSVNYVEP